MRANSNGTRGSGVRLKILGTAPSPWQSALLPVPSFPVPAFQMEQIQVFLRGLQEVLVSERQMHHELLYQVWKLSPATGANVLSQNTREWSPGLGMGIWPDRKPPQSWTEEMMVDAAAAVFRGDEPEFPSYRLLLLKAEEGERKAAAAKMRGFGAQIELFSQETIASIQQRGREVFLPAITERRFQRADFYLPVLDTRSIQAAGSTEKLEEWLCGIEVYVRESAEDGGILILSRHAIDELAEQVRLRLEESAAAEKTGLPREMRH